VTNAQSPEKPSGNQPRNHKTEIKSHQPSNITVHETMKPIIRKLLALAAGLALPAALHAQTNVASGTYTLGAASGYYNTGDGYAVLPWCSGGGNVGVGAYVLYSNTGGSYNTAVGYGSMVHNATSSGNVAVGGLTLQNNAAANNTAIGYASLFQNRTGTPNTAVGYAALYSNVGGSFNAALGDSALFSMSAGTENTAMGHGALSSLSGGTGNIAIGSEAGVALTTGSSDNIIIGNPGVVGDSNVIRIGTQGIHASVFIAGVFNTPLTAGTPLLVDNQGMIGTGSTGLVTFTGNLLGNASTSSTASAVLDNTISNTKIVDLSVTSTKIADGSVTTAKIADGAVTNAKLAANSVTGTNIAAGAVSTTQLAANAVTGSNIAASAVGTTQIADASVTGAKVASGTLVQTNLSAQLVLDTVIPAGSIMAFAGPAAPTGWAFCDGTTQSSTDPVYSRLYQVIGITYGAGVAGTFNLPDLRGRVIAGLDMTTPAGLANRITNSGTGNPGISGATLGAAGGVDRHTLTLPEMPQHDHGGLTGSMNANASHSHQVFPKLSGANQGVGNFIQGAKINDDGTGGGPYGNSTTGSTNTDHQHSITAQGANAAHSLVQPTIIIGYIIKL
jgi:microcystin-dependent protein